MDSLKKWIGKFRKAERMGQERKYAELKVDEDQVEPELNQGQFEMQQQYQHLQNQYQQQHPFPQHQFQGHPMFNPGQQIPPLHNGNHMQPAYHHGNQMHPNNMNPMPFGHQSEYHGQVPVNERVHLTQSLNKLLGIGASDNVQDQMQNFNLNDPVVQNGRVPSPVASLPRGASLVNTDGGYKSDDEASDYDPKRSSKQSKSKKEFKPQMILKNPKNKIEQKPVADGTNFGTNAHAESLMNILVPKKPAKEEKEPKQRQDKEKKNNSDSLLDILVNPKSNKKQIKPTQILKRPTPSANLSASKPPIQNQPSNIQISRNQSRDELITQIVSPHSARKTTPLAAPILDSGLTAALSGRTLSPSVSEKQSLLDILQGAPLPPQHNTSNNSKSDELLDILLSSSSEMPLSKSTSSVTGETRETKGNGLLELLLGGQPNDLEYNENSE